MTEKEFKAIKKELSRLGRNDKMLDWLNYVESRIKSLDKKSK